MEKDFYNLIMKEGIIYSINNKANNFNYEYFKIVCKEFKELTQDERDLEYIIQDLYVELEGEEPLELLEQWELGQLPTDPSG